MNQVQSICSRVMFLEGGRIAAFGDTIETIEKYIRHAFSEERELAPVKLEDDVNRFGSRELEITDVSIENGRGENIASLQKSKMRYSGSHSQGRTLYI